MANQDLTCFMWEKAEEEDVSLAKSLSEWADTEVIGKRLEYNEDYEKLAKPAMKKLFLDIEMQKLIWKESYGGAGHNSGDAAPTIALALEQIGRADTGMGFNAAVMFALNGTFALEENLNEKLCSEVAPLYCNTKEPLITSLVLPAYGDAKSDDAHLYRGKYLQASAKKEKSDWIINGKDIRPLNSGLDAGLFGIFSYIEGEKEPGLFLVPGGAAGLKRGPEIIKTGLASARNAEITLSDVKVPAKNLIFKGENPYRRMLIWLNMGIAAVTVGSLFAAYEIIKEWGDKRVIKGKNSIFKENPLTASLMAEVSREILLARMLTINLAGLIQKERPTNHDAMEKLFVTALSVATHVSSAGEKALNQIMELMASAGYATEWNLERYWRDVKTMQLAIGNRELNNMDTARYFYGCKTL